MRRLFIGLVVAAATTMAPMWTLAGNQEVAETIAASLQENGQLEGYQIGVKYQEGTVWLEGTVGNRAQVSSAMASAVKAPGVTRVVNNLSIESAPKSDSAVKLVSATEPASGKSSIQQIATAISPDQTSRLPSPFYRSKPRAEPELVAPLQLDNKAQPVAAKADAVVSKAAQPARKAERVASTFSPTYAQRVAATSSTPVRGPTLASPSVVTQRTAVPQTRPIPIAYVQPSPNTAPPAPGVGAPVPRYTIPVGGPAPVRYDQPHLPAYSWPSYAAHPNYAALTYPKRHSATAWPYIGPFYPYPQVPLGWRKVVLEWHDGWWQLDFDDTPRHRAFSGLFRPRK